MLLASEGQALWSRILRECEHSPSYRTHGASVCACACPCVPVRVRARVCPSHNHESEKHDACSEGAMSTLFIHIATSQKCGRTLRLLTPGRGCRFLTTTQTSAPGTGSRPGPFPVTLRSWPLRFGLRLYPPISPAADHARERGGSGVRVGARSASSQMMDEAMAAWFLARGVSPRCETPFRSCLTSLGIVCSSVPSALALKKKKRLY